MPNQYKCPKCATMLQTAAAMAAGQMIKCPKCATVFAPVAATASKATPAAPAASPAQRPAQAASAPPQAPPIPAAPPAQRRPPLPAAAEQSACAPPAQTSASVAYAPDGMKTSLIPGETCVKHGAANMQRGAETVGGWLYLTNKRLIFEAHAFNIQSGTTRIGLPDTVGTQPCWTKFLNLIPLFPNSFAVSTNDGKESRFVTFNRQAWIEAIEGQRTSPEPDALARPAGMDAGDIPVEPVSRIRAARMDKGWSVLGIISLVLGVLGLPLSVIPCINAVALPFVGIGLLLGGIGILMAKFGQKTGIGMPIAGTAVNFAGLMFVLAWMAVLALIAKDTDSKPKQEQQEPPVVVESTPEENQPVDGGEDSARNDMDLEQSARVRAVGWIKANNAFGPMAKIVRDLSGAIDDAEEKGNNLSVTLGSALTKSGKATSFHLFSDNFFVFELTDAQAKQLGLNDKTTIVRTPKRHDRSEESIAKLYGLKFDSGSTLEGSKKITGQVNVKSLEDSDPEEKFALRLSYQARNDVSAFCHSLPLLPLKTKVGILKFSFEPMSAAEAAAGAPKFSGPMPVFLDLCVLKKNDQGFDEVIILSNTVGAMVDVK